MASTTWTQARERITREAVELRPMKVLVTILVAPFFLIGLLIGLVWFLCALVWQSIWVGVSQAHASLTKE